MSDDRPLSEAEREKATRLLDHAARTLETVGRCLIRARHSLDYAQKAIDRNDPEELDMQFGAASDQVLRMVGHLSYPEVLDEVEAGELAVRDHPTIIKTGKMKGRDFETLAWDPRKLKRREVARTKHALEAEGLFFDRQSERKLSSVDILGKMRDKGWGNDKIAEWLGRLLELTEKEGTIRQRAEVANILFKVLQHTEPRNLFEIKDVDIEGLSDEELDAVTKEAATLVHQRLATARGNIQ